MTNLTSKLIRSSRYIVLSAGFLFQAHSLFAAEPVDTHVQVRAFLNPPIVSNVKSVDSVVAGYSDAGEQVRAFILGNANVGGAERPAVATAATSVHGGNRDYTDFLNSRNELFRRKKMKDNPPSRRDAIRLMTREPNLIRRPVIVAGGQVVIGFDEDGIAKL